MRLYSPMAVVTLFALGGCSAVVEEPVGDENRDESGVVAWVDIAHQSDASGPAEPPSVGDTRISARFVRVSGGISQAAAQRLVGSSEAAGAPADGCRWLDVDAAPATDEVSGSIELLDVGEVALRSGDTVMPLAARAFPDVGDLISGVVYTSRGDSEHIPAADRYWLELGARSASASTRLEAPQTPERVQLQQLSPAAIGPQAFDGELIVLTQTHPLNVRWAAASGNSDDILFRLQDPSDGTRAVVCRFDDNGSAEVPARFLDFDGDVDVSLTRSRQVEVKLDAGGALEAAVVDFDFTLSARATVTEL